MKTYRIEKFTNGWFVGDFNPSLIRTDVFECGAKFYSKGESEVKHVHKIACEITVVADGIVEMQGRQFSKGDIIFLEAGEATNFVAVTDAVTFVVKMPSVIGDKYVCED